MQQQQLWWSAACQWLLDWICGGAAGEEGVGFCGCGSWGVRQLMVMAPAGHTGASCWRTSEPPHSSTQTLPTLAPSSSFKSNSLSPLSPPLSLSLCLSYCLSQQSSLPPTRFSSSVSLIHLVQIQIQDAWPPLNFSGTAILLVAGSSYCVLSTFYLKDFMFFHIHHLSCLYCLPQILLLSVPRKYLVAWT